MKYFLLLILIIGLLAFVMIRRSKELQDTYQGKSDEEIKESTKRTLP